MKLFRSNLAAIQYGGVAGITKPCFDAILRLIQYNDQIKEARILSDGSGRYGFIITIHPHDYIGIKCGFSSGYNGEGPRTFSYVIQLLGAHSIEIDEYKVTKSLLNRLDNSALTNTDIKTIFSTRPIRPQRFHDHVCEQHWGNLKDGTLWQNIRTVIPFSIIDTRISDLAVTFWENPDNKIMDGYRRLEDILRKRTGFDSHGATLFAQSFTGDKSKLSWKNVDKGEQIARANLFRDAYSAYRNPRAHKELDNHKQEYLSEFLLLNHLYRLEKEAVNVADDF
jgi:hypothetical protein